MAKAFKFSVNMEPHGQGRPRFGNGRVYESKADIEAKRILAEAAKKVIAQVDYEQAPNGEPVVLIVDIYGKFPKSLPKKVIEREFTIKPDVDNVAKSVMDALSGIAYEDDSQVVTLVAEKHAAQRGIEPHLNIEVFWRDHPYDR